MKNALFSFVVLIYNEEDTVTYLLESIKYQIIHYGHQKIFELILADDASKDQSCIVADKWLENNIELFHKVVKIYAKENKGTCQNLCKALRKMEGEQFYLVAGDDILASGNMFAKYRLLEQYDIIGNGILKFSENKIIRNRKAYLNIALQAVYTERYLRSAVKYGCPILNGAIIKRELLTETVLKRMEQFVLLDDRSRYYQIFAENTKIRYGYDNEPILLYRQNEQSVSNMQGKFKIVLNEDIKHLYYIIACRERSKWTRALLKYQSSLIKFRGETSLASMLRYLSPYYMKLFVIMLCHIGEIRRHINVLVSDYSEVNNRYIQQILGSVEKTDEHRKD